MPCKWEGQADTEDHNLLGAEVQEEKHIEDNIIGTPSIIIDKLLVAQCRLVDS